MTLPSTSTPATKKKSKRIRSEEYKEQERRRKKAKRLARTPEQKALESQKRAAARKAKKATLAKDQWQNALEQNAAAQKQYRKSMTLQQNQQHAQMQAKRRSIQAIARNIDRDQNRAHFQMKTFQNHPDSFHAFENHPETLVLLYHLNSGHEKFRDVDYLTKNEAAHDKPDQPHSSHMEALLNEITAETLTLEENEKLLKRYLSSQGRSACQLLNNDSVDQSLQGLTASIDAHHLVCGACGMKCINGQYG